MLPLLRELRHQKNGVIENGHCVPGHFRDSRTEGRGSCKNQGKHSHCKNVFSEARIPDVTSKPPETNGIIAQRRDPARARQGQTLSPKLLEDSPGAEVRTAAAWSQHGKAARPAFAAIRHPTANPTQRARGKEKPGGLEFPRTTVESLHGRPPSWTGSVPRGAWKKLGQDRSSQPRPAKPEGFLAAPIMNWLNPTVKHPV